MKKLILIALMMVAAATAAPSAEAQGKASREQWMTEMRQYKRNYLAKELELTKEQQNKFFPLYEAMEDECAAVSTSCLYYLILVQRKPLMIHTARHWPDYK